jgi:hypothetical protein
MLRVGISGCGRPRTVAGATGFGMSHAHAPGYRQSAGCTIVALADIDLDNARAFQAEHGGDALDADYREMLARASLDLVDALKTGRKPELSSRRRGRVDLPLAVDDSPLLSMVESGALTTV